jgi:nucleoside 2-deoxyribosyltransferase
VPETSLEPEGGDIFQKFLGHLARASVVVADITDFNPNVMYELGHVHATGRHPFLYNRGALGDDAADALPFYLKGQSVETANTSMPDDPIRLAGRLRAYLEYERSIAASDDRRRAPA